MERPNVKLLDLHEKSPFSADLFLGMVGNTIKSHNGFLLFPLLTGLITFVADLSDVKS